MGPFATQPFGPGQFLREAASLVVHLQQANFSPQSLPRTETAPGAGVTETGTGPSGRFPIGAAQCTGNLHPPFRWRLL